MLRSERGAIVSDVETNIVNIDTPGVPAERVQRSTRLVVGTPDRLPPKPYVREGLRLEALSMLREQDRRSRRLPTRHGEGRSGCCEARLLAGCDGLARLALAFLVYLGALDLLHERVRSDERGGGNHCGQGWRSVGAEGVGRR